MKRGKPLKRTTGLARGKSLRADAEKVRAFLNRGRQPLARTPLIAKPKVRPQEGPLSPAEWRKQVFDASEGECIISGARARDAEDRRFHCHHPLPKRELRARGLFGRVWDARNGVFLRRDVHERHESPGVSGGRVPAERLPASVWEFCAELDEIAGHEWATQLVLRAHPYSTTSEEDHDGEGEGRERDRRDSEGR